MATILMNGMGEVTFEEYGRQITDPSEITYIKRHSDWKSKVYELSLNLMNQIDSNINSKRNTYKYTPKLITNSEIQNIINNLQCKTYSIATYKNESFQEINNKALQDSNRYAEINASKKPFWKKDKNRKELAAKKLQEFIDFYKDVDAEKEAKYYEHENNVKQQKDSEYLHIFNDEKNSYLKIITDNEKDINNMLIDSLNDFSKKFDITNITSNYNKNLDNTVIITVSLPNDECIEFRKGNMLASGKISVKQRPEKEIIQDWYIFCYGIILNMVATVFNVNTCIKKVLINTKYSELNKVTGNIVQKDFINCLFERNTFEKINFTNIDPELTVKNFETTIPKINKQITNKSATAKKTKKRKYEIQDSSELSNISIDIIITSFKTLIDTYSVDFFEEKNEHRFLSAIKDILPKNESEQQLVRLLVENHFLSELVNKKSGSEQNVIDVMIDNNITEYDRFLSELKKLL